MFIIADRIDIIVDVCARIETMYRNLVDVIRHQRKNGQYVREAAKQSSSTRGSISKYFISLRHFLIDSSHKFKIFVQKKTVLLYTSDTCFE